MGSWNSTDAIRSTEGLAGLQGSPGPAGGDGLISPS